MAKSNKDRAQKVAEQKIFTEQKLPDGTRKYKMFKQDDEKSAEAVQLSRFLLRHIDRQMLDAMTYEEKDEEGNVTGSEIVVYTRDDEKGDIIFTIAATYLAQEERKDEEEVREKNDSPNRETPPTNN